MAIQTSGGGARRGAQVLQRLHEQPPAIWYQGEAVKDVTTHPARFERRRFMRSPASMIFSGRRRKPVFTTHRQVARR